MIIEIAKRVLSFIAVVLLAMNFAFAEKPLPPAANQLQKATVAAGDNARLQQFFNKAAGGGKIVLGVLGGSITEGAVCAKPARRYHGVILDWFRKTFPKTEFTLVNAGIGSTGSDYGALRIERDLLSKNPDIVILEYAVNDGNSRDYAESYEGVVRQILKATGHPALLLLFMMRQDGGNAQEWETKVGERYRLPMLSYRDALWPEIQAGRLKWAQISPDTIHPNESGHVFAGELICAFLEKEFKSFKTSKAVGSSSREQYLPEPLISDLFEHCLLFDRENLKPVTNKGWEFDGSTKLSAGWKSSVPGSVLEFEIEGEAVFLSYWRIRGLMGKATASVDGGTPTSMDAWFDKTWGGYGQMVRIARGLKPGKHKVRVELLQERNAQSQGSEFRVLCVGSAGASTKQGELSR